MKKNMGSADRIIRLVITLIIVALYFSGVISGTVLIILGIIGGIFLLTSLISFCPLYALFGLNTCSVDQAEE
ncbi:MAG: DUF2892 domain-containing protein [Balneolaceae bacterium]